MKSELRKNIIKKFIATQLNKTCVMWNMLLIIKLWNCTVNCRHINHTVCCFRSFKRNWPQFHIIMSLAATYVTAALHWHESHAPTKTFYVTAIGMPSLKHLPDFEMAVDFIHYSATYIIGILDNRIHILCDSMMFYCAILNRDGSSTSITLDTTVIGKDGCAPGLSHNWSIQSYWSTSYAMN